MQNTFEYDWQSYPNHLILALIFVLNMNPIVMDLIDQLRSNFLCVPLTFFSCSFFSLDRNGTSMISLIIPPKDQISRVSKMLADEFGTASNIKSRVNRLSVLGAITSVQHRLKLYTKVPPNGLVIYCGTIVTEEGKEKKVNIDFEPFKPINTSLYLCDNKFHTEALTALLADDNKFGFIVMDGNGALFGTLQGNTREVLHKFTVDLPKKHGRGGQSALRFARLRMEKRHNYVRKVAEVATQLFITNDKPNIAGLILAGSADFKTELSQSDMFDPVRSVCALCLRASELVHLDSLIQTRFSCFFTAIAIENYKIGGRVVRR